MTVICHNFHQQLTTKAWSGLVVSLSSGQMAPSKATRFMLERYPDTGSAQDRAI